MSNPLKISDPNHILSSATLAQIEGELPGLAGVLPAWAETVQLLINNVRNGRIALHAAVERIGLNLENL